MSIDYEIMRRKALRFSGLPRLARFTTPSWESGIGVTAKNGCRRQR
jgi:hypothetical protein